MSKKIFLIANPKSGRAKIKNELMNIVDIFTRGGYTVTVYPTARKGDAITVAANLSDEYDTVVCCGGDGTLNEVINGLMQNQNHYKLGYIPAGTLNEWSSGLKISHMPKKAAEDILNGEIRSLDIGLFCDRYFSYTACFGAFTSASYSAPQNVKNAIGQTAYFFEGIKSLSMIKPSYLKFVIHGKTIEANIAPSEMTEILKEVLTNGSFEFNGITGKTTATEKSTISWSADGKVQKEAIAYTVKEVTK